MADPEKEGMEKEGGGYGGCNPRFKFIIKGKNLMKQILIKNRREGKKTERNSYITYIFA